MGLRHSEMFGKLSADINRTEQKLVEYVQSGVVDADGKVQVLRRREEALVRQLLEMIAAQGKSLNDKIEKLQDFTASVETEMQAGALALRHPSLPRSLSPPSCLVPLLVVLPLPPQPCIGGS
jgi:hypothetical protein